MIRLKAWLPSEAQEASANLTSLETIMTNIDIAKTYIRAVQAGDLATLGSIISPEIVWHQPGDNQFSGVLKGLAEVGSMLGKMVEISNGTFAITKADHFMSNGDWVAIAIEFAGEANGIKLSQPGVDLMRIDGGRIVEMRLFSSNQEQEDQLWGK